MSRSRDRPGMTELCMVCLVCNLLKLADISYRKGVEIRKAAVHICVFSTYAAVFREVILRAAADSKAVYVAI